MNIKKVSKISLSIGLPQRDVLLEPWQIDGDRPAICDENYGFVVICDEKCIIIIICDENDCFARIISCID